MLVAATFILSGLIKDDELLLARQLIKNTQPIAADNIRQAIGSKEHIVINISQYQARDFDNTIDHIEQLLIQNRTNESFNIEIVANNNGLKALDTITSAHAERINQIAGKFTNLKVIACAKSLADLASEGDPVQLMKSIMITPSAAQQVAKRTSEGWLYLKI